MAITGFGKTSIAVKSERPSMTARCINAVRPENSAMSAPAIKALSPAPVMTTTRTSSSFWSCSKTAAPSSRVLILSAFLFSGRLMVTIATRSRCSTRSVSYDCGMACDIYRFSGCQRVGQTFQSVVSLEPIQFYLGGRILRAGSRIVNAQDRLSSLSKEEGLVGEGLIVVGIRITGNHGLFIRDPRHKQPQPVVRRFGDLHANPRGAVDRRSNTNDYRGGFDGSAVGFVCAQIKPLPPVYLLIQMKQSTGS